MNIEQRDRIKQIAATDCKIRGRYMNSRGDTCIIGALHVSLDHRGIGHNTAVRVQQAFGLSPRQMALLIAANDSQATVKARRAAVQATIDEFEVSE